MISQPLDKQLPHGVADLFFNDAARKRAVERSLADTFARWGYSEIIPPSFEYFESLAAEAGPQLREEMYRFFDRDGRTLALRADYTIPTARIVGTKLFDRAMPLRFFYVGSVFRYEEPQAGVRREFTQAGIELVGASTADAEQGLVGQNVLPAEKAEQWGLIWKCVDDAALANEAQKLCEHFAAAPTQGLALIKQALNASATNTLDVQLDLERDLQRVASLTPDYAEGVRAFMEKRQANFTGRRK